MRKETHNARQRTGTLHTPLQARKALQKNRLSAETPSNKRPFPNALDCDDTTLPKVWIPMQALNTHTDFRAMPHMQPILVDRVHALSALPFRITCTQVCVKEHRRVRHGSTRRPSKHPHNRMPRLCEPMRPAFALTTANKVPLV